MDNYSNPIEYIKRTERYYQALGYGNPYQWACFETVPFTLPSKPLSQCTVGIVSTAAPYQPDKGDQGPGAEYNAAAKFFSAYRLPVNPSPDLRISHVAIDRDHTTANDQRSYLPIDALTVAHQQHRIGGVAEHIYGLPTNRSQSHTLDVDCAALLQMVQADELDAVVLVPNCPVCHQSVSLAARTLEDAGILTVVLGCAKDIVEHVGVPRFLFSDFPLGNAAGIPNNTDSQRGIMFAALNLLETATSARTTLQSPYQWPGDPRWKSDYANPDKLTDEEIRAKRAAFDSAKRIAKANRET